MKLTNPWIGYVQRGYEQIMTAVIARLPVAAPEITDYSYSNPFIKALSVFAGICEHIGFYVDVNARESFLDTCRNYSSAIRFANLVDYRVRGVLAAAVDLEFYVAQASPTDTTIPAGTVARTKTGIEYQTTTAAVLRAGQLKVTVPARNWKPVASRQVGVSNGTAGQRFALGAGVVDSQVYVTVGSTPWAPVDTFAYSTFQDKHFRAGINVQGQMEVLFPDGASGAIPLNGQPITVNNFTSDGAAGNAGPNTITELSSLVTSNGVLVQVRNPQRASGGANAEGLAELKKRIPLSLRTLERAVTDDDYIDVALMAPGVAQAGLVFNCGKFVYIYVYPTGGGIASTGLLLAVENYFDSRRMVTTKVIPLAAGEVVIKYAITLRVAPNYERATTVQRALDAVVAFHAPGRQKINGSIHLGDVYEQLENTEGVEWSEITLMSPIPFARAQDAAPVLDWDAEVLPDSTSTIQWRITVLPNNKYELVRGNIYLGDLNFNQQYTYPQLELTVRSSAAYSVGDVWEFTTYAYSGSLTLAEQSLPVTDAAHITIIASGGL
jgi:uncharacterized phage protein gp47/JayE